MVNLAQFPHKKPEVQMARNIKLLNFLPTSLIAQNGCFE